MEKQVIYRDRQHLEHTDLNNTQDWAHEAHAHLVTDALTPEKQYIGLTVTAASATEISVSSGRLYDGSTGMVYALDTALTQSLFSYLPLVNEKWLAVSVLGQTEDVNLEPRDFLVDLATREVEPQVVAMQRRRVVVLHIASGLESTTPEQPNPPTGHTPLAHVRLNPSGIQQIVLATSRRLPNLYQVNSRLQTAEGWILSTEPRLATLTSDIAGLQANLTTRATLTQAMQLGLDMARVKERLEIPDTYKFYGGDHFLTLDETDIAGAGYSASVQEGVRFPSAATDTGALFLLNPLDPAVKVAADGLVLPSYTEIKRLALETQTGELIINQYQYQTFSLNQKYLTRTRIRYGAARTVCTNGQWWLSGQYDVASGIFRRGAETWEVAPADRLKASAGWHFVRLTQFWVDTWQEPYWEIVATNHTVQGSLLAQTLLMAQTGWLTSVEIYLTLAAADGALNVLLTDALLGQPNMAGVIARETIAAGSLAVGWNKITFARPVFVEAGQRYALALVSGGAHKIGIAAGTAYTQGLLMYSQDGAYFSEASEMDLMLRLNFARFDTTRAVAQLSPLQLVGGIHDLDILFEGYSPPGCQFFFEVQLGGVWYPIVAGQPAPFSSAPALVPLRMVFLGTLDLMPSFRLTDSVATVSRGATSFLHWSTERTVGSNTTSVKVRVLVEGWIPAKHALTINIKAGGTTYDATETVTEIVDDDAGARWLEASFTPSSTSSYVIKLTGTTTDALDVFHVAERYDLAF